MHSLCWFNYYFGSRCPYVDYRKASLCVLAPGKLFLHTEQDWNFTRTCSRTYVSIITALMRTMKLLLAYVHHALNPQPKAMVFITMSLCNHIPSPATVGYVVLSTNQLFCSFPTLIANIQILSVLCYPRLQSWIHWIFIVLLAQILGFMHQVCCPLGKHGSLNILLSILSVQLFLLHTCLVTVIH